MSITGPLARAARALVQLPRAHVARLAAIGEQALADFEAGLADPGEEARQRLRHGLEASGAVFLDEDREHGGVGVRLKFTAGDVRQINRMEGEGGQVGEDDI
jgi:hypothetical protein